MKKNTERDIEILMAAGRTRYDAERADCIIYEDLEENLEKYCAEWAYLDEEDDSYTDAIRKMVIFGIPAEDWGIAKLNNKIYYIQYIL